MDDTLTDIDQTWNVRLDPSSSDTAYNGLSNVDVAVTTLDDEGAPVVNSVTITSTPATGDTYVLGETIAVQVGFDQSMTVTGTPQLALTIGTATRQAAYAAGASTATALTFRYTVVQADADGISIGAGALALNGGTIRQAGSPTVNAELGLGFRAVTNSAAHRVTGGTFTTPAIAAIRLTSSLVFFSSRSGINGLAYGRGEVIEITVTFSRLVTATPIVPIDLPSTDNYASFLYVSGTGTRRLVFHYTVAAGHIESSSLRLQGNDLLLNGGTINDARDSTVPATLTVSHAQQTFLSGQGHEVDGNLIPTGITVSQSTLAVTERSTGTGAYTVHLTTAPASDVVVTATRSSTLLGLQRPLDATWAAAETLTFTATSWNTQQTVYVEGREDVNRVTESETIRHAVYAQGSADEYDAVTAALPVTIRDNDGGLTVDPQAVTEGDTTTGVPYTVALSTAPSGPVTVNVPSGNLVTAVPGAAGVQPDELEYGAGGDGNGGRGRRRRGRERRDGDADAHGGGGQRRPLHLCGTDGGQRHGDDRRRRDAGDRIERDLADRHRGDEPDGRLYGGARRAADGGRGGTGQSGRPGLSVEQGGRDAGGEPDPDVHDVDLEHGPDDHCHRAG